MSAIYSESVEMYLKTLAELGGDEQLVPIARLAERLNITTVSAGETAQRLVKLQLISHTPYKGVGLTPHGLQLAQQVIRRQRLWECLLVDYLQLDWAHAPEWACQLEHATAPEVTAALANFLGHPSTCPHGKPIPDLSGAKVARLGVPLATVSPGVPVRVLALQDDSVEVLEYLRLHTILPGQKLTVLEAAPRQGPLTVRIGLREEIIGLNVAALVLVEPVAA
jgi:DtxR family transcriptional regulator, Mn-dependent transcriptional regulator